MTICWGKRRAVPPTTDHENIQGKRCPQKSVLYILRNEAITQTPIRWLFTSSKEEKELLWGFYLVPLIQSFENQFQTCIQHVRPSGVGSFAYQQVGFEFSGSKGHILCGSGMMWHQRIVCIKLSGLTRRMLTYNPRGTSLTSSPSSAVKLNVSKSMTGAAPRLKVELGSRHQQQIKKEGEGGGVLVWA